MSMAKNKVAWCLNKAKKELEKDTKHRGLVRINADDELAREFIKKAEHNLQVFIDNKRLKHYDWTISMGFYVMYHCCLAIITKFGYESRNQGCTLALIESLIEEKKIEDGFRRYIVAITSGAKDEDGQIMAMREKYQYTPVIEIDIEMVEELLGLCQDMIKDAKGIIAGN